MADGSIPIDDQKPNPEESSAPSSTSTQAKKPTPKLKVKPKPKPARDQSGIQFPYLDLEAGISVVRAVMGAGGVSLSREQLAGVMGQSVGSGSFVTKVATARLFGLMAFNQGKYELTNLGFAVLDSDERRAKAARGEAFLKVPLYSRTYEEFRGRQLPPRPNGLEQAFVQFGVAPKQKTNARLAFDRSAKQAGFFSAGQDRLIEPIIGGAPIERGRPVIEESEVVESRNVEPAGPDMSGFHPFVQGLLQALPEPETNWTIEGRAKWLQTAANIFDLIYKGTGEITITSKGESSKE